MPAILKLPPIYFMYRFFEEIKRKIFRQAATEDTAAASAEVRKKYNYGDVKGKIIIEIEIFEKKDKSVPAACEGIDCKTLNESLLLCEEIKEIYKVYNDDSYIQNPGKVFEEMAYSIKKAEEYHPWENVIDELKEI